MGGREDPSKIPPATAKGLSSANNCDLNFRVNLVGVKGQAAATLVAGAELSIRPERVGQYVALLCVTSGGDIVGTLAAFVGLAKLVECMQSGIRYQAIVVSVSATSCSVDVKRLA